MTDLSNKKVRFVDNGLFFSFAQKIRPAFGELEYYTTWQDQFARLEKIHLGEGFDGIKRIRYLMEDIDSVDLWIFPDLFYPDFQVFLEEHGHRVWGARFGEDMELQRWGFKRFVKQADLLAPNAVLVHGTKELREELKGKKGKWIKLADGTSRGNMETWKWKDEQLSETYLTKIENDFGAFKYDVDLIVEDEIEDSIEPGEDLFTVDGQFPDYCMSADEVKGLGMLGVVKPYKSLPPFLLKANEAVARVMAEEHYRGWFCLEGLYNKRKQFFLTDPCCRLGSPSNELLQELFTEWPRTIWDGAEGIMTSPKRVAKYGLVAMVYSEFSGKEWQPLQYAKEIANWVKLRNPYAIGKHVYSVPQGSAQNIAGIVGIGNTILEAVTNCAEHAKEVRGHLVEVSFEFLPKVIDIIQKSKEYGLPFSDDPAPTAEQVRKVLS